METGVHNTIEELAASVKIDASYASRVLRLTMLAPNIIENTLAAYGVGPTLSQALGRFPAEWNAQRQALHPNV